MGFFRESVHTKLIPISRMEFSGGWEIKIESFVGESHECIKK